MVATFTDVPEAITGGGDRAEALAMAEDALATALAGYVHAKRAIPAPSKPSGGQVSVPVPSIVVAKLALYSAMNAQNVNKVELAGSFRFSEAAARKLANPDRNSRISRLQKALNGSWV